MVQRRSSIDNYIRKSWQRILFVLVFTLTATFVLLISEKRNVRRNVSLDEAMARVETIEVDANQVNVKNGQILHIIGKLHTNEALNESDYNIQVHAVKLKRHVEMYQWIQIKETKRREIDFAQMITYYYEKHWKDSLINSSLFHNQYGHENPQIFPIENRIQIAAHVNIGNFELGKDVKTEIDDFIDVTSDTRPADLSIKLHSGLYYHCTDIFNPEIGDIRLEFTMAGIEGNYYTIVGQYKNGLITTYETSIGTNVLIVLSGNYSIEDSFHAAHYEQKLQTWGLRFIGWILLFFACACTYEMLSIASIDLSFASKHPLLGIVLISLLMASIISSLCWLGSVLAYCVQPFHYFYSAYGTSCTAINATTYISTNNERVECQ